MLASKLQKALAHPYQALDYIFAVLKGRFYRLKYGLSNRKVKEFLMLATKQVN